VNPPDYTFDPGRLAALASHAILDTPAEPGFDGIVQLAAHICETPVALVSLVAEDRQWFKARVGFSPCQTDLSLSVCAHALVESDILIIPDLTRDERSKANPLVTGDPNIRFYAGAPFHAATGEALGSLCVIDTMPRPAGLTEAQADSLRNLARQVTLLLGMRRATMDRDALVALQRESEARRLALLRLSDSLREMTTPADMTRVAARIAGQTLNVSRVGFSHLDEHGEHLTGGPDWTADGKADPGARPRINDHVDVHQDLLRGETLIIRDVRTDPRTAAKAQALLDLGICSLVNMPVRERGRTVAVFIVHDQNPRDWAPEGLAFLRNVADRLEVAIARLKAQAEQQVLNHELTHRLKNTFAMIQAIATQTLRAIPDQEPVEAFISRLHALSAANDVLLPQRWTAAPIGGVVRNVAQSLMDLAQFDLSGPPVELGPRATLSLSLLLHELGTNAIKYGSLSQPGGRVAVTWRLDQGDEPELVVDWREAGGPPVSPPTHKGFGSKLIRMGLVGAGGVELRYQPSGLEAEFRASLARVQQS
jgi:two-component sensor histidine kinase